MTKNVDTSTVTAPKTSTTAPSARPVDMFLSALTDPVIRDEALSKLHERGSALRAELQSVEEAERRLTGATAAPPVRRTTGGRPRKAAATVRPQSTGKVGRPPGKGADHGGAIRAALHGERNGLTLSDLHDAIVKGGHEVDKKTVATYLRNMINRKEMAMDGERGSYLYKLVSNGKKA